MTASQVVVPVGPPLNYDAFHYWYHTISHSHVFYLFNFVIDYYRFVVLRVVKLLNKKIKSLVYM